MKYICRYRNDSPDHKKWGTYLISIDDNQRQHQLFLITHRQMSKAEMERFKAQYILTNKGYPTNAKKFTRQIGDDDIKEIKFGENETEISDITRDPTTGSFKKEKKEDREYISIEDDHSKLEKIA